MASLAAASSRRLLVALRKTELLTRTSHRSTIVPLTNSFLAGFDQRAWFSSYPDHEVVGLPKLSPTMDSGSIASWNLNEGDQFGAGDILCSVETDKATVDFEAQDEGVLARILVESGPAEIPCGAPIMITVDETDDVAAFKDYVLDDAGSTAGAAAAAEAPSSTPPPTSPPSTPEPAAAATPPPAASSSSLVIASPLARMLSKEMGYDISLIPGTGPGGRIIAADVKEFDQSSVTVAATAPEVAAAAPAAAVMAGAPAPPIVGVGFTDYPLDASAREAAARLAQSKRNVPHYYLTVDINMDEILKTRSTLNSAMKNDDDELGVYELLIKAAGSAMKAVPTANASWMDSVVRVYDSVDINVVIGSGESLFTPVIRNCGSKGVKAIAGDLTKATTYLEQQQIDEGNDDDQVPAVVDDTGDFAAVGTFTIINLGMYGVKSCAPIVREPQACALALGTLENRIVPNDDVDSESIYKESVVMTATLSCDHRVVDGAVGAQWLAAFKSHIENPATLLL